MLWIRECARAPRVARQGRQGGRIAPHSRDGGFSRFSARSGTLLRGFGLLADACQRFRRHGWEALARLSTGDRETRQRVRSVQWGTF